MMRFSRSDLIPYKAIVGDAVGLAAICVMVLFGLSLPGV